MIYIFWYPMKGYRHSPFSRKSVKPVLHSTGSMLIQHLVVCLAEIREKGYMYWILNNNTNNITMQNLLYDVQKSPIHYLLACSKPQSSLMIHHLLNYISLIMKTLLEATDNLRFYEHTIYQIHMLIGKRICFHVNRQQKASATLPYF